MFLSKMDLAAALMVQAWGHDPTVGEAGGLTVEELAVLACEQAECLEKEFFWRGWLPEAPKVSKTAAALDTDV